MCRAKEGELFLRLVLEKGPEVIKTLDVLILFHDNTPFCLHKLSLYPEAGGVGGANSTRQKKSSNAVVCILKSPVLFFFL